MCPHHAGRPLIGFSFAIGEPLDQLAERDWQEQLAVVAEHGFDLIEWTTRDASSVSALALRRAVETSGVGVAALGTGMAALRDGLSLSAQDSSLRAAAAARVLAAIRLAAELEALVVVGLIRGQAGTDESARGRLAAELCGLADEADAHGTRVVVEPINRYETDNLPTVADVMALVDEVGHQALTAMADLFHMNIEEPDPEQALVAHAGGLAYVHVADSNRRPPGWGHLPLTRMIDQLLRAGYAGPLVCEVLPSETALDSVRHSAAGLDAVLSGCEVT